MKLKKDPAKGVKIVARDHARQPTNRHIRGPKRLTRMPVGTWKAAYVQRTQEIIMDISTRENPNCS